MLILLMKKVAQIIIIINYFIDIHSPTQLIVTLCALNKFNQHKDLADKVLLWTINNMQDKKGFFIIR
jgi:hypothetical protein